MTQFAPRLPPLFVTVIASEAAMRFSPAAMCLTIAVFAAPMSLFAQGDSFLEERTAARHELELAKMELRHYVQIEYPRLRRHLDAQIRLTEAEIRAYRERLREYRPFDRFSLGQPFLITLQELKMCLFEAELRLRDLWAERNALVRFHSDDWRVLEMKVHEARLRVAAIEAENVAMAEAELPQP